MKIIATAAAIIAFSLPLVQIGHAEVNVNVNVGIPPIPVPVPGPPRIVLPAPPEFILPSPLGFYVAVDVPYDIFRVGTTYYLYKDNNWYRGSYYNGPWRHVKHRHLPPGLRKHSFDRIRHYRDEEYRRYSDDRDHYSGRRFKPTKAWKEERKEHRRYEKEERKRDKRERKEHGRHGGRD